MKSGNLLNVQVVSVSGIDNAFGSKIRDTIKSEDLILRYLGYFNFWDFGDIEDRDSFYISGLKPDIAVYIEKSNNTIELLGIYIYITNIKKEVLSTKQVHELYSLREIEIIFKT